MRKAQLTAGEVRFRASPSDVRRLAALGKHYEMGASAILRRLIGDAWRVIRPVRKLRVRSKGHGKGSS